MKKNISICFRVDADEKLGLGHLSRCRSLMLAFLNVVECEFSFLSNNKEMVKKFISSNNFDFYDIYHSFKRRFFDILIVDVPDIANKDEYYLKELSDITVSVDDDGPGLDFQDILIRPNLLNLPKPSEISSNNYWSGRDYIILHPDFEIQAHKKRSKKKQDIKNLFVCFGGGDPFGMTLRVIPLLKRISVPVAVHIVLGPAFLHVADVELMLNNDPRFSVVQNVSNMAGNLSSADIAMISGGTLLYEACCLGIPSVVLSQNKSQEIEAKICHKAGAAISLGLNETLSDNNILVALQQLLRDKFLRKKMVEEGPKIISPNGATCIVSKLLSFLKDEIRQ